MKQILIQFFTALVLSLTGVTWLYAQQVTEAAATTQGMHTDGHQTENPSAPQENDEPADENGNGATHDAADMQLFKTDAASDSNDDGQRTVQKSRDQSAGQSKSKSSEPAKPVANVTPDATRPPVIATDVVANELPAKTEEMPASEAPGKLGSTKADNATLPKTPNLLPNSKPWSFYKPLLERNIFTRQQAQTPTNTNKTPVASNVPVTPVKPAVANWVLTGIVINEQGNYAFFENSQTNVTLRIAAGQSLGETRIKSIEQDHVLLAAGSEGQSDQRVDVGSTLDGSAVSLGTPSGSSIFGESTPDTSSTGSTAADSSSPATEDPSKMSIIERMRARRLREGGK